ncbi:MAG: hypothetical protein DMF69_10485, partial [Acidobacteria bacterium]
MTFLRALLICFTVCLSTLAISTVKAQAPEQTRIRTAVETTDWATVRSSVENLRSSNPSVFRVGQYDYLLGRVAEQTADLATASAKFETVASSNTQLAQYALWRLARIARANGDLVLERERLRRLLSVAPDSLLLDAARLRLAESFFESDDLAGVSASAQALISSKNVTITRQGALLVARANLRAGKLTEARDAFKKLLMQMPDASRPDDFALIAVRELDELDKRPEFSSQPLSEADHLLRASVYQFNRDFAGARVHYQAVVDRNSQSGVVDNATYQIGRGLYLESKYDDAIKLFQSVVDRSPQSQSGRDALGQLAASYLRLKRIDDAVATYKLFITRFPEGPNAERPYLNIIDALHEAGRYLEALNWVQQTRTKFKTDLGGALALFAQQRIHLAQNSWAEVVRDADELLKLPDLGGTRVGGGTTTAEVS